MTDQPTNQQLDEYEALIARTTPLGAATASPGMAAVLLAEVRRLRAVIDAEKTAHRFTLRQRNNRSRRLAQLHDLAVAGDLEALAAAAKDTLAASVDDHRDCHERAAAVPAVETGR